MNSTTDVLTSASISPIHSVIQSDKIRKASIVLDVDIETFPRISSKQYRNSEHSEEHVMYVHGGVVELRDV
jgi:5,10-methylene-tetrahydrofolate dehydrogenase/methenyl tetrahydrofolate cyclohydrolase